MRKGVGKDDLSVPGSVQSETPSVQGFQRAWCSWSGWDVLGVDDQRTHSLIRLCVSAIRVLGTE